VKSAVSTKRWRLQGRLPGGWFAPMLIVVVAISASVSGIRNQWAQDDEAIIVRNTRVQAVDSIPQLFGSSYWPPPHNPALYRPLATTSLAVQWAAGGGTPLAFRLTSYLLYALVSLGVFFLGKRLLPGPVALGVAVLFAAHPVHVEAVALAVNQGEQWVGLLSILATNLYLDRRRQGWLSPTAWLQLGGLYLAACLFKENGLVLPGLLIAAELTLLSSDPVSWKTRARRLGMGFGALTAIGLCFLFIRSRILGELAGDFTAEALTDQGMGGRILTMLQVVPRWLGLLIWPSHLQADYSPSVILQATSWGWAQTLGAAVLAAVAILLVATWRRAPVVAFGILWAGGALLPVSNVLIPTGIVLAERTLFLPSIGFMLACGGVAHYLLVGRADPKPLTRLLIGMTGALALLGVWRSAVRHPDFQNQFYFWARTVEDAPLSYRAHHAQAQNLWRLGYEGGSVSSFHTAMALYPPAWWVRNELANRFRLRGDCYPALELYDRSLEIEPNQPATRASRIACLVYLGRYEEAIQAAEEGVALGTDVEDFRIYRATADSARRAGAPPGSVQMRAPEAAGRQ
jgi:protein O-mannosyl-transferase